MIHIISNCFEYIANVLSNIVFFNILFFTPYNMPISIFVILIGVIYFTIKLKFIHFRMFGKACKAFLETEKEIDGNKAVTSRAAFFSAISGCVGVGNISGVAAALFAGGPGAVLWMLIIGFLVTPLRYAEVFLGHFFRTKASDGSIVQYGPYAYIENGLKSQGYSNKIIKILFVAYAVSILFGSIGAFIMQVNPLTEIAGDLILQNSKSGIFIFSILLATLSLFVVVGGLKRIIHSMQRVVSVMSIVYLLSIIVILAINVQNIPNAIVLIFKEAFNMQSVYGGILGIIIVSFTRIIISTEVGLGSVAFLHGKSQNDNSVREGLIAMIGPVFANFIFITLNSIAVIASLSYLEKINGILMIKHMFHEVHFAFPFLLLIITFLFAFTTIVAWYFYAESSIKQITSKKAIIVLYRILFFILISISGLVSFGIMLKIIDAVVISIVFPNIIALILLGNVVKNETYKTK